jgi:hypothetical protein
VLSHAAPRYITRGTAARHTFGSRAYYPLCRTASLPPTKDQLNGVEIKSPIVQEMLGRAGLFRQVNTEAKGKKSMSLRQWVDLCADDVLRAPGVKEVGVHVGRAAPPPPKPRATRGRAKKDGAANATPAPTDEAPALDPSPSKPQSPVKAEPEDDGPSAMPSPPRSDHDGRGTPAKDDDVTDGAKKRRGRMTKEEKEAQAAASAELDEAFLETFDPETDWLPPETAPEDYTPEFCRKLERQYWRNLGLGRPAWYGADTAGTLFTPETTAWNVGALPSMLARLLPSTGGVLPGVNAPYLYFGMWRATFAWHVEDMDLFSINYIHFGAPKFWYAMPQARANALEQTMKGAPSPSLRRHQRR